MNLVRRLVRVSLASTCSTALLPWNSSVVGLESKAPVRAFSAQKNFARDMQVSCHTPSLVLSKVGSRLSADNDPDGKMASLVLVRLAKMMITQSNDILYSNSRNAKRLNARDARNILLEVDDRKGASDSLAIVQHVSDTLAKAIVASSKRPETVNHDISVEGIKAAGILARLLLSTGAAVKEISAEDVFSGLGDSFHHHVNAESMGGHHVSGLTWAYDCLSLANDHDSDNSGDDSFKPPESILSSYKGLNLPFRVRPGFLSSGDDGQLELTVPNVRSQVDFRTEEIKTTATNKVVKERRQTAWEGEDHVPGFQYSGKVMETRPFSPVVAHVRDELKHRTGRFYDCCLLNLYPDGDSGMRYHSDPDQGDLWGYETAVVSGGAARRFSFRETDPSNKKAAQPHNFLVMDGDVVEMVDDCQRRFQHTVKTAEGKHETAPRCSMVFKQCLRKGQT